MSARSVAESRKSALGNGVAQSIFVLLLSYLGWTMYAVYTQRGGPDPIAAGMVKADQLSPYFAATTLPAGLAGLIIAAVVGSTMSVVSGGINAAASCVYVDLLTNALGRITAPDRVVRTSRIVSLLLALLAIALAFAASQITGLVKMGIIATSLCSPLLGVFLLGLFVRRANALAANVGLFAGLVAVMYLSAANIACGLDPSMGACEAEGAFAGANLSVFWFGAVGTVTTFCFGLITLPWNDMPAVEQLQGLTWWTRHQLVARELQLRFGGAMASDTSPNGAFDDDAFGERQKLLN